MQEIYHSLQTRTALQFTPPQVRCLRVTEVRNFHRRRPRRSRRHFHCSGLVTPSYTVCGNAWDCRACPRGLPRRWRPARAVIPSSRERPGRVRQLPTALLAGLISRRQRTRCRTKCQRKTQTNPVLGHLHDSSRRILEVFTFAAQLYLFIASVVGHRRISWTADENAVGHQCQWIRPLHSALMWPVALLCTQLSQYHL